LSEPCRSSESSSSRGRGGPFETGLQPGERLGRGRFRCAVSSVSLPAWRFLCVAGTDSVQSHHAHMEQDSLLRRRLSKLHSSQSTRLHTGLSTGAVSLAARVARRRLSSMPCIIALSRAAATTPGGLTGCFARHAPQACLDCGARAEVPWDSAVSIAAPSKSCAVRVMDTTCGENVIGCSFRMAGIASAEAAHCSTD
jgi:hypothetical protein